MSGSFTSFPIPRIAAQMNRPLHVNSLQELRDYPAEKVRDDQVVIVRGHYSDKDSGGGDYIRRTDSLADNNGTHIPGWVFREGQSVTPMVFGARTQENVSSADELEAFYNFCGGNDDAPSGVARNYMLLAAGFYKTDRTVNIINCGSRTIYNDIRIDAMHAVDDIVLIKNCANAVWVGKFSAWGHRYGTSGYSMNDTVNAIALENNRNAKFCDFNCRGGSGWGIYHRSGNSNMMALGNVEGLNWGANGRSGRHHYVDVTGYVNNDVSNIRQYTTVQLSPGSVIPSRAHRMLRAFFTTKNREPYKIISINRDNNSLRVYPLIPDADQIIGQCELIIGGLLCLDAGGFTAKGTFLDCVPTRCGTGLWLTGYDSPTGRSLTSQFSGVGLALGNNPDNVFSGTSLQSTYFEMEEVAEVVHCGQTESSGFGTWLGGITAVDINALKSLSPRRPSGALATNRVYFPIMMIRRGEFWWPDADRQIVSSTNHDSSAYPVRSAYAGPHKQEYARVLRSSSELILSDASDIRRLKGVRPTDFTLYGAGGNGQYTGTFTVRATTGFTINGNADPIVLSNLTHPITLKCIMGPGNNWIVTIQEHTML
ncbi:hypothetical protein KZO25_09525 [Halomonas sp. ANAO-440]|uniref:hypothetical protein n=1 Tax=Halomonas sp. ANAO-440 TaxID=2861360 RepID=UPI001CAA51C5|nr:hypothetical protein [Halomonas sp. ANAO-440]MBZ0330558.1 hypothetical protein [Halomonas sp. ANAO-440]